VDECGRLIQWSHNSRAAVCARKAHIPAFHASGWDPGDTDNDIRQHPVLAGGPTKMILRVIQGNSHRFDREASASFRVIGEQFPEFELPHLFMVGGVGLLCRAPDD